MIKKECFYTTNNNTLRVISMDMRGNFDLGSLKTLSEKKEGRQLLEELTRNKEASLVMLQDEALLSTVIRYEEFSVEMTIAHCLVFGGDEEIRMRLAKMPARILELKTGGRDKVVEFLIAHGSTNVKEVLAENPAALGIICGEALSESGHMEVLYGLKARVMDSERAKMLRGNCIAHLLLGSGRTKEIVEKISRTASEEVLAIRNGTGTGVRELLEEARTSFGAKRKSTS
jgi:hypothetical protein